MLRKFFFCNPWLKHCQVLANKIEVLMAAATREDNEFKTKPKSKTIDNQAKNSITSIVLFHAVLQLDWTPSAGTQKINFPANQKGHDKSETTYEKLLARRIQIH